MTRERAQWLVAKLTEFADPRNNGTPGERQAATERAAAITKRYGLDAPAPKPRPTVPRKPTFTAPARGPAYEWDFSSFGPDVKVHEYKDKRHWRIEIPL